MNTTSAQQITPPSRNESTLLGDSCGVDRLYAFIKASRRLVVLTGAGVSTESGIPDYRSADGSWKRKQPVQYQDFVRQVRVRQRYWARSLLGWQRISNARINPTHQALAQLEAAGHIHHLITQNVDSLHHKAGSQRVIDLHGRLALVECLHCRTEISRFDFQTALARRNGGWTALRARYAPDGDADLEGVDFSRFDVPECAACGGILKPAVVFFGEAVPKARVQNALARLKEADALLVIGSSLMVWSGYRFVKAAAKQGIPVGVLNLGRTRADTEIDFRVAACCADVLPQVVARLARA